MGSGKTVSPNTDDQGNLEERLVENLLKDLGFGEKEPNKTIEDIMASLKVFLDQYREQHSLTARATYNLGLELCKRIDRKYAAAYLATKMKTYLNSRYAPRSITSN